MPYFCERSSSVTGSSRRRRSARIRRSRSLSVPFARVSMRCRLVHTCYSPNLIACWPVLRLGFAVLAQGGIERLVRGRQPAVRLDAVLPGHVALVGDGFHRVGREISLLQRSHLVPQHAQVEEELLLRGRRAERHP